MPDFSNSGVLFKNDRKERDNQPDYTGKWSDADGNEMELAAWIKDGKNGKFMSLKASEPRRKDVPIPDKRADIAGADDLDDEIPF